MTSDRVPGRTQRPGAVVVRGGGDGRHDDTERIQEALDSRAARVCLAPPERHYVIRRPLRIHSNQMLEADPSTAIRLAPGSDCLMLRNADPERGDGRITVIGGIWDMDNENQSLADYQRTRDWHGDYDPDRYLGVLLRMDRVRNLCLRGLTLRNPVTFGTQLGNLEQFTIEGITFDYNLARTNMDGIHIHGNSRCGRIANIQGTTNDDLVALNADDGGIYEMSRGPIEDVLVDGLFSQDGYTAVRLLSAGSPVRRIRIANVFGTYRYNAVSLTNHQVHPGADSTFDDISISGLTCAKSTMGMDVDPKAPGWPGHALVWVDAPARVSCLSITDFHRTESAWPAENIAIMPGAEVSSLQLANVSVLNRTPCTIHALSNRGTIGHLSLSNVSAMAGPGCPRGLSVCNDGGIGEIGDHGGLGACDE